VNYDVFRFGWVRQMKNGSLFLEPAPRDFSRRATSARPYIRLPCAYMRTANNAECVFFFFFLFSSRRGLTIALPTMRVKPVLSWHGRIRARSWMYRPHRHGNEEAPLTETMYGRRRVENGRCMKPVHKTREARVLRVRGTGCSRASAVETGADYIRGVRWTASEKT